MLWYDSGIVSNYSRHFQVLTLATQKQIKVGFYLYSKHNVLQQNILEQNTAKKKIGSFANFLFLNFFFEVWYIKQNQQK